MTLLYDTGALLAAERDDRGMWLLHRQALTHGVEPIIPVVVLAQAWRGGPQHSLSRLLKGCELVDVDTVMCRQAGALCAAAGTADVVDALVVVTALTRSAAILTSDLGDIGKLVAASGRQLPLRPV